MTILLGTITSAGVLVTGTLYLQLSANATLNGGVCGAGFISALPPHVFNLRAGVIVGPGLSPYTVPGADCLTPANLTYHMTVTGPGGGMLIEEDISITGASVDLGKVVAVNVAEGSVLTGTGTVTSLSEGAGIVLTPDPIISSGTIALEVPVNVTRGGTGTSTPFTPGSVIFAGASGVYSQDNAQLFWDDTNNRLGVGTATPSSALHLTSPSTSAPAVDLYSTGISSTALRVTGPTTGYGIVANAGANGTALYVQGSNNVIAAAILGGGGTAPVLHVQSGGATSIGMQIQAYAAQTADLLNLRDSSGSGLGGITSQGAIFNGGVATSGALATLGFATENLVLNTGGTTTDTSANLLPANSIIRAITIRVTTTITVASAFSVGDPTTAARFCATGTGLTAGSTNVCLDHIDQSGAAGPRQTAAAKVRITTTGTPAAGAVRIVVFYETYTAPTS